MLYIYNSCNYATVKNRTRIYKEPIKRIEVKRIYINKVATLIYRQQFFFLTLKQTTALLTYLKYQPIKRLNIITIDNHKLSLVNK